jgi:hypothetical protein
MGLNWAFLAAIATAFSPAAGSAATEVRTQPESEAESEPTLDGLGQPPEEETRRVPIAASLAFIDLVQRNVADRLRLENMPMGTGGAIELGVLVLVGMDRVTIFDQKIADLQHGRLPDRTPSAFCRSHCSAAMFQAFARNWLTLVLESSVMGVQVPTEVLIAADARVPISSFLDTAYASAESRPVQPPAVGWVVVDARTRGLRVQRIHLAPPEGIAAVAGALQPTIVADRNGFTISTSDPQFARQSATSLEELNARLGTIKRKYPGKEIAILVPSPDLTVGDVAAIIAAIRDRFGRFVVQQAR